MVAKSICWASAIAAAVSLPIEVTAAKEREWTDKTGKYKVSAELFSVDDGQVVLRDSNGKELRVALERLSRQDQAFVRGEQRSGIKPPPWADTESDAEVAGSKIEESAVAFFQGLRSSDRSDARQTLTERAQELTTKSPSPLAQLPEPATGDKAIVAGKAKIDDKLAEIPVRVRAGGKLHRTKLHLRLEDNRWQVFAISATYPDGEKSINFEAELTPQRNASPLEALVGNRIELAGYTIDGRPLDMSAFSDKVVLVDFWATWCGPCRAEMANIRQNWQEYHADGFEVIAISVDRDLNSLQKFVVDEQPPWTVVADYHPHAREKMSAKYGIRGIPAFILIGRDGKVAAVNCRGPRLGQQLAHLIRAGG